MKDSTLVIWIDGSVVTYKEFLELQEANFGH